MRCHGAHSDFRSATKMSQRPEIWLKEGHTLKGRDVLPVVLRMTKEMLPEDLASPSKKSTLTSYTADELSREFKNLTGYDIQVRIAPFFVPPLVH